MSESQASDRDPDRGFDPSEYEQRLARAQRAMEGAGIDALLLTGEADIRWFSGFLTAFWQSPTRPWFLVVPRHGKPVAVIPSIGEPCMRRTWLDDVRSWSSPHPDDDGVSLLADALLEAVGPTGSVGVPMCQGTQLRMPLSDWDHLRQRLATVQWHDAGPLVSGLRMVKSPAEVAKIARVCTAASAAFARVPELLQSGMSDVEAFRAFRIACLHAGVDDVDYLVGAAGQGGYGDIISPPSGRTLRDGDVLILDTGCSIDGHFCDFDRNWSVGDAGAAAQRAYAVSWEATEAGLEAVRPGVRCDELFSTMDRVMAPHACSADGAVGRLGHGLGTQLTEPPSIVPHDRTVLQPGMVITLEPGFAFAPDRWMVHEENLVVTDTGYELLSERAAPTLPRLAS